MVVYKMTGSGNDFVFVDGRAVPMADWGPDAIRALCARGTGIGADGLVVLERGSTADAVRFHFFNSDGGRAAMCGNAALCATRLAAWLGMAPSAGMRLETDSGVLRARCLSGRGHRAEIEVPAHGPISQPPIDLAADERSLHYTQVGVPHLVVCVSDVEDVAVCQRGRELRMHPAIQPNGANVNFVSGRDGDWVMRTYERGVEDETLACGTGAVAAAAVLVTSGTVTLPWTVRTGSGCALSVSGESTGPDGILNPRLAGEGRLVFRAVLVS